MTCSYRQQISDNDQTAIFRFQVVHFVTLSVINCLFLFQGSEPNIFPNHLPEGNYYDENDFENLQKRNPPAGFSAARGKRKFLLDQNGWAPRSNSLEQYQYGDYPDVISAGARHKKIPFHGGFMASRGKRSSSISKRSPVVDTLLSKSKATLWDQFLSPLPRWNPCKCNFLEIKCPILICRERVIIFRENCARTILDCMTIHNGCFNDSLSLINLLCKLSKKICKDAQLLK